MLRYIKHTLFLLTIVLFSLKADAASRPVYDVLYVQSYTERDTWNEELIEGLTQGFKESSLTANLTVEYLNSRYWDAQGEEEIMRQVCRRAEARGVDMIVVSNDEALYSLLACGDPLPSKVPVVFFGVEFPNEELMSRHDNLTGFILQHPYDVMLETIKHVFPQRTNTVVLSEDTPLGEQSDQMFKDYWENFASENPNYNLREFNVTNDPLTEILSEIQISAIAHQSVMIVPYWGLYMPSIAKVSKAPTFTMSASALFNGVFCIVAPNAYEDARAAGLVAGRILNGETPASIPIRESPYELTFDYQQLKFFGVKKDQLPKHGIVVNEPYVEKYGLPLMIFYTLLVGLLILVVVRLVAKNRRESRRRMHAQTKLLIQDRMVAQRNEFDNIFDSIRDGVITLDMDGRIHFINKSTMSMLNLTAGATRAQRPYEGHEVSTLFAIYNNKVNIMQDILKQVIRKGVSVEVPENSFIQDLGTKSFFPIAGELVPLYDKNKQSGLVFTFRNISDVALQKRFFNLAVEESAIYPWQFSQETDSFTFPESYMVHMGLPGTVISRTELSKYLHPENWKSTIAAFDDIIKGESTSNRFSFRQRNSSGNYEWWEFRVAMLSGPTEDVPYSILGVCQSIQRYKVTEEELIAARDRALQADKLKSAFLANMSHEIRTPLNSIVGFSDILKDYKMYGEEDIEQFIATINKNCELLLTLINDILDLSRVEAGSMDFQFSPYYLPIIMQEIYNSQKLSMPLGVELKKSVPVGSERTIITDPVRMKQVITNLINNAAKFTSKGSITFGYTEEEAEYTTFFVEDTGAGISKEDQKRIFERFYKVDSFTQGAGLGLSIVQTIVNRFNGTINVSSVLGKGSRFTVRVPNKVS